MYFSVLCSVFKRTWFACLRHIFFPFESKLLWFPLRCKYGCSWITCMEICLLLGKKYSDFCTRPNFSFGNLQKKISDPGQCLFPWGTWRLTGNPVIHFNLFWITTTKLHVKEFRPSLAVILKNHFLLFTKALFFPCYCTFFWSITKNSSNVTVF